MYGSIIQLLDYNIWENSNLNIVGYPAKEDIALDELVEPF